MSTTLTNAAAEVNRLKTEIETHKLTFPDYVNRISDADYHSKKTEYDTKLARLQEDLRRAEIEHTRAMHDLKPPESYYPKGGKKSRKSHNSKKSKKSKKSHTTYKRSKRSRR
jgi:hypothetical protein